MRGVRLRLPLQTFSPISLHHRSTLLRFQIPSHLNTTSITRPPSHKPPHLGNDKYERNATKYWNNFYKHHQNKFFKDRHYLEKDWGCYFSDDCKSKQGKVVLEIGCGAGNTIFPLVAVFPNLFVHACDFSPHAIALVQERISSAWRMARREARRKLMQAHADFRADRVNAFVCDVTVDDLSQTILPSSVDVVTLIFMLSAVSPRKMSLVLQNIRKVLKPNGYVLLRDYAIGDFAQEKLIDKNQLVSENFYVRGDGTCAFYFSEDFLSSLFKMDCFNTVELSVYTKEIENRSRKIVMNRCWIRGVFCRPHHFDPQPAVVPKPDDNFVHSQDQPMDDAELQ